MTELPARPRAAPLRVLFSMRNFWYVKLFDSVIRELASRGCSVQLLAEPGVHQDKERDWIDAAAALAASHPGVSFAWAPHQIEDDWVDLRVMVRLGLDHLRFLGARYRNAPVLGLRARSRAPEAIVRLADAPLLRTRPGRWALRTALRVAERAVPADPRLSDDIAARQPDVILVTPMLDLGSQQVDVVRIARRLGIPSVLCVGSWDHLSSKALIREWPDLVLVWNETQRREAVELHGMPRDRIVVTGAQCFDQWFARQPALNRADFCRRVGLDPGRPYVLYVCSALFEGSPSEARFVVEWIRGVRASGDPRLAGAGILVRPHPKRASEWSSASLGDLGNVSLWPPDASAPFDAETKSEYFDSIFHSAAVVGLNTSALIEGGIVGRPVHTVLLPEFHDNQEGTVHFRYLLDGGLLQVARDLPAHYEQLAAALAASDDGMPYNQAFVTAFVRPAGADRAATPVFADAVERIARERRAPRRDPWWVPPMRRALRPLALRTSGTFAQQLGRERRRVRKAQAVVDKARARETRIAALHAQRAAEKAQILAARQARREEDARAREERRLRGREEKARLKEARVAARHREKESRRTEARRHKRLDALNARMTSCLRRVTRPFSTSR